MYFGEFLLYKKVLTEEQLLDALIYQVENLPSFLRVLKSEKLLSSSEIMKLVQLQYEKSSDLLKVIRSEKKLSEDNIADLYQIQASKRKMLGSVLVELKILDASNVEKLLHEYLRDKDKLEVTPKKVEKIIPILEKAEVKMSSAAIESLKELGMWSEELLTTSHVTPQNENTSSSMGYDIFIEEYLNLYSERMDKKLNKLVVVFNETLLNSGDLGNYMSTLYKEMYILGGASKVASLAQSNKIFSIWNEILEKAIIIDDKEQLREWCVLAIPNLENSLKSLWEMRQSISQVGNESGINTDKDLLRKIDNIVIRLNEFKSK